MLHPTGWSVATPAELQAYGWTTIDLWCAPVTTAIYALLTHAQPFWAELHALLLSWAVPYVPAEYHTGLGISSDTDEKAKWVSQAIDPETARAACAIFLTILFVTRTVRNFGGQYVKDMRGEKRKVIRASKSFDSWKSWWLTDNLARSWWQKAEDEDSMTSMTSPETWIYTTMKGANVLRLDVMR